MQSVQEKFDDWLLKELFYAYNDARKGKQATTDEYNFEMNAMRNLIQLRDDILNRQYKPSRGIAFVTRKPVIREIFAAPFRDRVVHHFLFNQCADWWDKRLIYDSYSCRAGKGTLMGIQRLAKFIQNVSENYQKETYVIKLDIQGYFMSLPREKLYQQVLWGLDRQFANNPALHDLCAYVWKEIIFDDPIQGVRRRGSMKDWNDLPKSKSLFCQPPGKGIVIGNLSSQLLSNIYLDQLDRFVKYELGYKYYGRYVDDFFIVVGKEDYEQAKKDVYRIEKFLNKLELTLHPKKRYYQEINRGVDFLGAVIYPGRIVPGKRFAANFYNVATKGISSEKELESIISYLGHGKHMRSHKLNAKIFTKMGWEYRF